MDNTLTLSWTLERDEEFRYQLLGRMKTDCDYYLGYGRRNPQRFWSGSEEEQIEVMKAIWNSFESKPEWLTWEQILDYEKRILTCPESSSEVELFNPEEIALAKRLEQVLFVPDMLSAFGDVFTEAYMTDEEEPKRTFKRIFKQYIEGSHDVRFIINDIFLSLCGYSINTLLDMSQKGETFRESIKISAQYADLLDELYNMSGREIYEKHGLKRDEQPFSQTVKFSDGCAMDINFIICKDDSPYIDLVLFDETGAEINCETAGCGICGEHCVEGKNNNKYFILIERA